MEERMNKGWMSGKKEWIKEGWLEKEWIKDEWVKEEWIKDEWLEEIMNKWWTIGRKN